MPVNQVREQAHAFVFGKEPLVYNRFARINPSFDALESGVPIRAVAFKLRQKFEHGIRTFKRRKRILARIAENFVESLGERQALVSKRFEHPFAFPENLVADIEVVVIQFVFGFIAFFAGKGQRALFCRGSFLEAA